MVLRLKKSILVLSMLFSSTVFAASEECSSLLLSPEWIAETQQLLSHLRRLEVREKPNGEGFTIRPVAAMNTIRETDQRIFDELIFSRQNWKYQIWKFRNTSYLFADIGFSNLELDSTVVNNAVLYHAKHFPTHDLDVMFGPERRKDLKDLYDLNRGLQEKVFKVYQNKKLYLDPTDFLRLSMVNERFIKNDSFFLSPLLTKEKITVQELKRAQNYLYVTIQAHYAGTGNILLPSIDGLVNAVHPSIEDAGRVMYFPFQFRMRGEYERDAVNRLVKAILDPLTTAEITRYLVLKNDLPEEVKSRLLLELFDRMTQRGIKVFVANLDAETFRLFKIKYGFRKLLDIPIHSDKHEVVAYLDTGSPEFTSMYRDLVHASSDVEVVKYVGVEREENGNPQR